MSAIGQFLAALNVLIAPHQPAEAGLTSLVAIRVGADHIVASPAEVAGELRLVGDAPVSITLTRGGGRFGKPTTVTVPGAIRFTARVQPADGGRTSGGGEWGGASIAWTYARQAGSLQDLQVTLSGDGPGFGRFRMSAGQGDAAAALWRSTCAGPPASCDAYVSHYGPLVHSQAYLEGRAARSSLGASEPRFALHLAGLAEGLWGGPMATGKPFTAAFDTFRYTTRTRGLAPALWIAIAVGSLGLAGAVIALRRRRRL